jgi:hypothetical protein
VPILEEHDTEEDEAKPSDDAKRVRECALAKDPRDPKRGNAECPRSDDDAEWAERGRQLLCRTPFCPWRCLRRLDGVIAAAAPRLRIRERALPERPELREEPNPRGRVPTFPSTVP